MKGDFLGSFEPRLSMFCCLYISGSAFSEFISGPAFSEFKFVRRLPELVFSVINFGVFIELSFVMHKVRRFQGFVL